MEDKFINISLLVTLLLPIWGVIIWRLFVMIQAVRYDGKAFIIQALLFLVYMVIAGYGLKYFGLNLGLSSRAIVSVFCYTGGLEIILFGVVQEIGFYPPKLRNCCGLLRVLSWLCFL